LFEDNSTEKILIHPIEGEPDHFNSSKPHSGDFNFERKEEGKILDSEN